MPQRKLIAALNPSAKTNLQVAEAPTTRVNRSSSAALYTSAKNLTPLHQRFIRLRSIWGQKLHKTLILKRSLTLFTNHPVYRKLFVSSGWHGQQTSLSCILNGFSNVDRKASDVLKMHGPG